MGGHVSLPVWIFLILLLGCAIAFFQYVIYPALAAFVNARSRSTTEDINPRLQLSLPQFTLTRRHVLADRLASDAAVEASLDQFAQAKGMSQEQIRRESWRMAWDIVPAFNPYFYFRIGYRTARAGLRALYTIRVAFKDEPRMDEVKDHHAVVFIINHRSNIDYAVANYLTSKRTMLSFGVGEWSRVWPIQPFFRMAGGYFVRRDSDDPHYRLLLKRYVQLATEARVPHAIFIEGQLSKDGQVSPPKMGLISYILETFDPESSPDVVFIPIGVNYDRVVEDVNLVRYSTRDFRGMGRRYVLAQGLRFLALVLREMVMRRQKFGVHCSRFGNPLFFSRWLQEQGVDWRAQDRSGRFTQVQKLGELLHEEMEDLVPATPMSVLCSLWHLQPDLRLTEDQFAEAFEARTALLRRAGCHVELAQSGPDTARDMALERAILTRDDDGLLVRSESGAALVSYYGNSIRQFLPKQPGG